MRKKIILTITANLYMLIFTSTPIKQHNARGLGKHGVLPHSIKNKREVRKQQRPRRHE